MQAKILATAFLAAAAGAGWAPPNVLGAASSDGVSIDHSAVSCVLAGQYPRMHARITPPEGLNRARLYFRAAGSGGWYFVEMKPGTESGAFEGTLPKPKHTMRALDYYIEAISDRFVESRTTEYEPKIVEPGQCGAGKIVASAVGSAKVAIGGGSEDALLPAGFSAAGVVPWSEESKKQREGRIESKARAPRAGKRPGGP